MCYERELDAKNTKNPFCLIWVEFIEPMCFNSIPIELFYEFRNLKKSDCYFNLTL